MSKITLNSLSNLQNDTSATSIINNNSTTTQTAIDNTLSRDGTTPNSMGANLDMNSNHILNLPTPSSDNEPLRLTDLSSFLGGGSIVVSSLPTGGTQRQVLAKNSSSNYDVVWQSETGTGNVVYSTSPTLVTPTIGAATATTLNGLTFTPSTGTLTLNTNTLAVAGAAQSYVLAGGTGTLTFQGTDTYVGRATTDTLTNKTLTSPTLTTPSLGVATGTSLAATGAITSSGTAGIGYATGAGGTVTQITNRTTGVILNKLCGAITMFSAAGTSTPNSFVVSNTTVASTDVIILNIKSGATNTYVISVTAVSANSFTITFYTTGGTSTDAPIISFNVIKGVTA